MYHEPCGIVSLAAQLHVMGAGPADTLLSCSPANDGEVEPLLIQFASLALSGLSIQNTSANAVVVIGMEGSVEYVSLYNVSFSGCGNQALDAGGAVSIDIVSSNVSMPLNISVRYSTFNFNSVTNLNGGAIDVYVNSDAVLGSVSIALDHVDFNDNSAYSGLKAPCQPDLLFV